MQIVACCRFVLAMSVLATAVHSLYQQIGVSTAALVPILDIINHSSTSSVSQSLPGGCVVIVLPLQH